MDMIKKTTEELLRDHGWSHFSDTVQAENYKIAMQSVKDAFMTMLQGQYDWGSRTDIADYTDMWVELDDIEEDMQYTEGNGFVRWQWWFRRTSGIS